MADTLAANPRYSSPFSPPSLFYVVLRYSLHLHDSGCERNGVDQGMHQVWVFGRDSELRVKHGGVKLFT